MKTEVFFGHHCPTCKITIGIFSSIGGGATCPGCNGPLQAGHGGPPIESIANFRCEHCGMIVGIMPVVGGEAKCPGCGTAIV